MSEDLSQLTVPELERLAGIEDNQAEPWWGYHDEMDRRFADAFGREPNRTRWAMTSQRTPSGKVLFRCKTCLRFSPTPDKSCPQSCSEAGGKEQA